MPDSTHDTRFALIEENFFEAQRNYYADMAAANTIALVEAIERNYAEAESAWAKSLHSQLTRQNADVKSVEAGLRAANADVAKARKINTAISALASKLQVASTFAGNLARIAAK